MFDVVRLVILVSVVQWARRQLGRRYRYGRCSAGLSSVDGGVGKNPLRKARQANAAKERKRDRTAH